MQRQSRAQRLTAARSLRATHGQPHSTTLTALCVIDALHHSAVIVGLLRRTLTPLLATASDATLSLLSDDGQSNDSEFLDRVMPI